MLLELEWLRARQVRQVLVLMRELDLPLALQALVALVALLAPERLVVLLRVSLVVERLPVPPV